MLLEGIHCRGGQDTDVLPSLPTQRSNCIYCWLCSCLYLHAHANLKRTINLAPAQVARCVGVLHAFRAEEQHNRRQAERVLAVKVRYYNLSSPPSPAKVRSETHKVSEQMRTLKDFLQLAFSAPATAAAARAFVSTHRSLITIPLWCSQALSLLLRWQQWRCANPAKRDASMSRALPCVCC